MAPKVKTEKEDILNKAFEIVRREGLGALTAKALAKELKCSTQPIFWWYTNMDEIKELVIRRAKNLFTSYLFNGIEGISLYKSVGMNYIRFAYEEKELFKLLYMSSKVSEDIMSIDANRELILDIIHKQEDIQGEKAEKIYKEMWLFVHGIATMIATDTASFNMDEVNGMLTDVYKGLIMSIS